MSDNTSGVPPRTTNGSDDSLNEFAAETSSDCVGDPLEEFAAEVPCNAEPGFARESAVASAPVIASTPTIAAARPVQTEPLVSMEPPLALEGPFAPAPSFTAKELSAAVTGLLAHASDESPAQLKLRASPPHGELVVAPPLFHPQDIVLLHDEPRLTRRWIPVVTVAAVLVALPSVWWSVSRRSSGPIAEEQETARQVESASPETQTARATPEDVAQAPRADIATSPATDPSAKPRQPASTYASTETPGVTANESAATPATVGFSPSFAPAVPGMFFHSGTGPASAIMRAETDESGTVVRVSSVVHDRSSNFHARPSPDGRWLAFDSDRDGERGIYVADVNGQGIRRVSGPGFASVPSWSPEGRRLAFVRAEPRRARVWNIWILDLATGDSRRITSHRVGQPWGAAWFPDGKRIAYSHENRLIVRTIDGKNVRIFNSPIRGRLLRTPAVSPDGKQIIFQVHRDGAWMLDVPSGSMSPVLKDPSAEEFTWSPDGQRVAYHSRRSGTWSVWVMAPRG